jgi:hypothetical protein
VSFVVYEDRILGRVCGYKHVTTHVDHDAGRFSESGPADEDECSVRRTFAGERIFDNVS